MATPDPDMADMLEATGTKKKALQGIWTANDGGPGPANWRKRTKGPVYGLVRRKGERNPMNWGFIVDDEILGHPNMQRFQAGPLPPRKQSGKGCSIM